MLNTNSNEISSESSLLLLKGRLAVFVSGFTMLMVQVVLLRELSSLYSVNELIVGVFLSFWMLFAGLGAFVARYFRKFRWHLSGVLPVISGGTALISLWLLYLAKEWLVPTGVSPGLSDWIVITALVAFVFCFPSGMMFTWFSVVLSNQQGSRETESVYMAEQGGSLLAGFLFYLVATLWVNSFATLTILAILNFLTGLYLFAPIQKPLVKWLLALGLLLLIFLWFVPQYKIAREMVLDEPVGHSFFSPHGSVDVVERDGRIDYFKNGSFVSGSIVPGETEELIHPALLAHPSPKKLLLVNVKVGLIPEALKYDSLRLDFLSPDKARLQLEKELLKLSGESASRVNFIHTDPVNYLKKKSSEKYDVILVGGGIPYNLASTRFFTTGFFKLIDLHLSPAGILATGGIGFSREWTNHRHEILMVLNATLQKTFPFCKIWAGEKVLFLASRKEISGEWLYHQDVLSKNKVLTPDYFPTNILEERSGFVKGLMRPNVPENTRVRPVLFQLALHDMKEFWDIKFHWFAVVLGLMLIAGMLIFRESAKGVFLAGIVLGGMQVVLLLFWQLVMGDMFRATGLLFSLFMAGLAVGAWLGRREVWFFSPRFFPVLLIILSILAVSAIPILDTIGHSWLFPLITIAFVLGFSLVGGAIFVSGLSLRAGSFKKTASVIYSADVVGGALGSFLTAIFFVPFTGMVNTGYLLGMAVLIAGLLMIKRL